MQRRAPTPVPPRRTPALRSKRPDRAPPLWSLLPPPSRAGAVQILGRILIRKLLGPDGREGAHDHP